MPSARFSVAMAATIAGLLLAMSGNVPAQPLPPPDLQYGNALAVSGLDEPVDLANARDGSGRLFVAERTAIRIIRNRAIVTLPFLDLSARVLLSREGGVRGLAFDPQFRTNRRFYVAYVRAPDGALRVSSFLAGAGNPDVADAASETEVITIPYPGADGNYGGHLAFAADGMLFVSTGDGVAYSAAALDVGSLLGKVLRLDVHAPPGYAVPPDNYYVVNPNPSARPEIAARGLRDPRKFSFDRVTRDLYIGDLSNGVGEIDTMPADYWRLEDMNYGWPQWEGNTCVDPPPPGLTCSAADSPQAAHGGLFITGGYVYRGLRSQPLNGFYVYARFNVSTELRAAKHQGGAWYDWSLGVPLGMIATAFGEDEAGELYIATGDGRVLSIDAPGPSVAPPYVNSYQANRSVDFDGDHKLDATWQGYQGLGIWRYGIWLMDGATITASAPVTEPVEAQLWDIGDFDGDGRSDRLWRDGAGGYWMDLVNGTTVVSSTQMLSGGTGWEVVGSGDFNADGRTDLIWRNGSIFGLWLVNGNATPTYAFLSDPDPAYAQRDARPAVFGDFNGDGRTDIVWVRDSDSSAALSLMDGATTTWSGTIVPGGTYWKPVMTADFNADGRSDIVWRWPDGAIGIWLMDGSTYSSFGVVRAGGSGWVLMYARDLDGDGKADLVWEKGGGQHEVWLMDGLTVKSVVPLDPGSDWYIRGCADYNGDGKADLLWTNAADPTTGVGITTSISPFNFTVVSAPPGGWGPW